MKTPRYAMAVALVIATLLINGCDRTEKDWQRAKTENTTTAYNAFLSKHPKGPHTDDANAALDVLETVKTVSSDGITIAKGDPDAEEGMGFFFVTKDGMEMPVSLRGNPTLATLYYTGTMELANGGKLGTGTTKFKPTEIETSKAEGKQIEVSSFKLDSNGFLIVSDRSGATYKITLAPVGSLGEIEEVSTGSK